MTIAPALRRRLLWGAVLLAAVLLVWMLLRPSTVTVDAEVVSTGPLRVTVDEEGETRVRDRYVVAAPASGRLQRVTLRAGDSVTQGQVLARITASALDPRTRAEAEAQVRAAADARRAAEAVLASARAALAVATREAERVRRMVDAGALAPRDLELAEAERVARESELRSATARARQAAELERAARAVVRPAGTVVAVTAPVSARVLRVLEESERVLPAGTPILELGDPSLLEVVVDVRSDDAVQVRPGQRMLLEQWGGDEPLEARVRRVEPAAFVEISALGVEERRVPVVADLVAPAPLGDRFRVEARIVVWEEDDVLRVPVGALYRQEGAWHAFAVRGGRAESRALRLGRRGATHAQVLAGLAPGDTVVLYPGDRVSDGTRVKAVVARTDEERP